MPSSMLHTVMFCGLVILMASGCEESATSSSDAVQASSEVVQASAMSGPPVEPGVAVACCPAEDGTSVGLAKYPEAEASKQPSAASSSESSSPGEGGARVSEWLDPADREPFDLDFRMTDQDGQSLALADLKGKPMAMSFIYTRCPMPDMCPLITTTMAGLQAHLDQAGLSDRVTLVLLSYDPTFDTPERLKRYGSDRGLRFTNAKMLRPDPGQFRELLHEFEIGVDYYEDGSIGHFIELLLIDHAGQFVRDYQGDVWDNHQVFEDLKKLVAWSDSLDG